MVGVTDADAPRSAGRALATRHDVAAGVDPVVSGAGGVERPGRLLDRPAFDVARRVELSVRSVAARVEGAAGDDREVLAGGEDMADVEARVLLAQLAPHQPADLAVRLVGAEARVDVVELGDDVVDDPGRDERWLDLDAHDRPHDGLDPPHRLPGEGRHP